MIIYCKKTDEEYEITDREIGERVECPSCGGKFVVNDSVLPADVYVAALIRKTEAAVLRDEPKKTLYDHESESGNAVVFDGAYECNNAEAQFQLARWLYDSEHEHVLAMYWFECAAKQGHNGAAKLIDECRINGFDVRHGDYKDGEQSHTSDLLEAWKYEHSEGAVQGLTNWREVIDINCPLCEANIKLPTRLLGGNVKCPRCGGVFLAKGEGTMDSVERRRYRIMHRFDEDAETMATRLKLCESAISLLRQRLHATEMHISGAGDGVGSGRCSPWQGVYLILSWIGPEVDVLSYRVEIRSVLESVLGTWVRLVSFSDRKARLKKMTFYIRQDRPCRQGHAFADEIRKTKNMANHGETVHPLVAKRMPEFERLKYLLRGDIGCVESKNDFNFCEHLSEKYHIGGKHCANGLFIYVANLPPDDSLGVRLGLDDGFGVVLSSPVALEDEVFAAIVRDIEKRISKMITFVVRTYNAGRYEYSFVPSISSTAANNFGVLDLMERRIRAIRASIKRASDSNETNVFREELWDIRNGVSKEVRTVQERAIADVESRIPFILRPFASWVISHRKETKDEQRLRDLSLKISGVMRELAIKESELVKKEKERICREKEEMKRKADETIRQKADAERMKVIDGCVDEITRFVKLMYEKGRPASIRCDCLSCQDGEIVLYAAEHITCVPKNSELYEDGTFVITNKRIVYMSERHMQSFRIKNIKDFTPCWTLDAGWIGIATSDKRSERYNLNTAWRPTLMILFVANEPFREKLLSQEVSVSIKHIWDKILSSTSPFHSQIFDCQDAIERKSVVWQNVPVRPSLKDGFEARSAYSLLLAEKLDLLSSSTRVSQECKNEIADIMREMRDRYSVYYEADARRLFAKHDALYRKFGLERIFEELMCEINLQNRSRFRL